MQELKGEPGLIRGRKDFFIISGPSGSGQSSVLNSLKMIFPANEIISVTTRSMRVGESEGRPYHFISRQEFEQGIENHLFFEWAENTGNLYGVTFEEINRVLSDNEKIILANFDYQGVITAKHIFDQVTTILLFSHLSVLEARIRRRQPNASEEFIRGRIEIAPEWLKNLELYDYMIENKQGKLAETIDQVAKIVKKHIT